MYRAVLAVVTLFVLAMLPGELSAQNQVGQEIREMIRADNEYVKQNLRARPGTYSEEGALEFWSSGGLSQVVPPDAPPQEWEAFNLTPKHIRVISLAEDVAMAMYYVEGSFKEKGHDPVDHYMTRAMQVFVKEGGEWKIRASHWSPILGGSGTQQTAIER